MSGFTRRGWLLLETLIAVAILVAAATVVLGLLRQQTEAARREDEFLKAVMFAKDAMARLDAGLESTTTIEQRSGEAAESERSDAALPDGWTRRVQVAPSPFPGLTLVTVSIGRVDSGSDAREVFALRQLVSLGGGAVVEAGEAEEAP